MPFVNITKENGTPTLAQKRELIADVTNLLAELREKNKNGVNPATSSLLKCSEVSKSTQI